jgi:O-antigen ligase
VLGWAAVAVSALWIAILSLRRKWPEVPSVLLGAASVLLLQGWWLVLNPHNFYDRSEYRFLPIDSFLPSFPGAVDIVDALPSMIRYTGMLGVLCLTCDLAQRPVWRTRLWQTVGLTGVSIVIFGLARKLIGIDLVSSANPWLDGRTSFATYFYHGNAGAFINLILPFVWGRAALSWRRWDANFERLLWIPSLFLCIAAVVVTASKAAMVIALGLMGILAAVELKHFLRKSHATSRKTILIYGSLALLAIVASAAFGWNAASKRWNEIVQIPTLVRPRLLVYGACLKMLPDSGLWGFGPGNFTITFPHYTADLGDSVAGLWRNAHEDYLQTLIEWGWFGAFFWAVILLGGLVVGVRTLGKSRQGSAETRVLVLAALVAVIGVALHALVDFPLQIASLQFYTALCLGLLWGSAKFAKGTRPTRPYSKPAAI